MTAAHDLDRHVRQAVEFAQEHVALHHRADIFRRAGIDDVAGFQLEGSDSFAICSATLQIMFCRSEFCLTVPLTASEIPPLVKCPVLEAG